MDADDLLSQPGNALVIPLCESASHVVAKFLWASTNHAEAVAGDILALDQSIFNLEVGTPGLVDITVVGLPVHSPKPVLLFQVNLSAMKKMLPVHSPKPVLLFQVNLSAMKKMLK
jgi:hypothetical protein